MKIKVNDAFSAYRKAEMEAEEKMKQSVNEGRGGGYEGYGQLLLKRNDLSELLGSCELEIEVPQHMEGFIA